MQYAALNTETAPCAEMNGNVYHRLELLMKVSFSEADWMIWTPAEAVVLVKMSKVCLSVESKVKVTHQNTSDASEGSRKIMSLSLTAVPDFSSKSTAKYGLSMSDCECGNDWMLLMCQCRRTVATFRWQKALLHIGDGGKPHSCISVSCILLVTVWRSSIKKQSLN